jgi:hypothetical protein
MLAGKPVAVVAEPLAVGLSNPFPTWQCFLVEVRQMFEYNDSEIPPQSQNIPTEQPALSHPLKE